MSSSGEGVRCDGDGKELQEAARATSLPSSMVVATIVLSGTAWEAHLNCVQDQQGGLGFDHLEAFAGRPRLALSLKQHRESARTRRRASQGAQHWVMSAHSMAGRCLLPFHNWPSLRASKHSTFVPALLRFSPAVHA